MVIFGLSNFQLLAPFHDFHETLFSLEWNSKERKFQGSLIADSEHFSQSLSKFFNDQIQLDALEKAESDQKIITKYLNHHIKMYANGKQYHWEVSIIEVTYADIIIHVSSKKMPRKFSAISILNTFMLDEFPNQKNLLKVNYLNQPWSYLFRANDTFLKKEI